VTDLFGNFDIFQAIGGLGLFLLGMLVMTDGLRAVAGKAMRSILVRFTHSPFTGVLTGAGTTAIIQSSSATTLATVGFVGAGLLSFSQAVGIIFGANIGTTVTGWLVALLGFKLKLGTIILPFIFVGAIMRLFARGKAGYAGLVIAGFGLIFVGISMMQEGMHGLQHLLPTAQWPADSLYNRIPLLLLGLTATLITQSSSAGVAATLIALYSGNLEFMQAATLIIGMDIGTTVTAMMATIGHGRAARRTGVAHVIFNLFAAVCALSLLDPYIALWQTLAPEQFLNHSEIALVAFHSTYNITTVVIILPLVQKYIRLLYIIVPDTGTLIRNLPQSLLHDPHLALPVVQGVLPDIIKALLTTIYCVLHPEKRIKRPNMFQLQLELNAVHSYVDQIHLQTIEGADWERLMGTIHTLDHLQRLYERCEEEEDRAITARDTEELRELSSLASKLIENIFALAAQNDWSTAAKVAEETADLIHGRVPPYRATVMAMIGSGFLNVEQGTARLEAIRWLRRVTKHIARSTRHFSDTLLIGEAHNPKLD